MLNAAYAMLAILPVVLCVARVRDGVAPDAQVRRAVNGEPATMISRLRARRAQRRREQREFNAWLEITAKPLWWP
jgi:hypothetical protein